MSTEKLLRETAVDLPLFACEVCWRRGVRAIIHEWIAGDNDVAVCRGCADRIQKAYAESFDGTARRIHLELLDVKQGLLESLPKPVRRFLLRLWGEQ